MLLKLLLQFISLTGLFGQKARSNDTPDMLRQGISTVCMHILQLNTLLWKHAAKQSAGAVWYGAPAVTRRLGARGRRATFGLASLPSKASLAYGQAHLQTWRTAAGSCNPILSIKDSLLKVCNRQLEVLVWSLQQGLQGSMLSSAIYQECQQSPDSFSMPSPAKLHTVWRYTDKRC